MLIQKTGVAVGALVLAGGLGACGNSASSGSAGGSGSPTDASKASFCGAFDKLSSDVSPKKAADALSEVGTPSDINAGARHGYEVLIDHLRELPDNAKEGDITQMARGLSGSDQADVAAFITYFAQECQDFPSDSSS
jgi:hypothetical protein